ncbi:MAG TPA: type II toxin-antitoxin system ParD family antitoxin [Chloroflexota bacterium]|nr:type II toxin-antitoxin system ParD family antitoxin [Chloroflexota bacterium]
MNVHLSRELEQLVQNKVQSGRYTSASEVIREALRLMEERDLLKEEIRKRIAQGLESQQLGKLTDGEEVLDRLEAELDALPDREA